MAALFSSNFEETSAIPAKHVASVTAVTSAFLLT
jgi:hypothetical protein